MAGLSSLIGGGRWEARCCGEGDCDDAMETPQFPLSLLLWIWGIGQRFLPAAFCPWRFAHLTYGSGLAGGLGILWARWSALRQVLGSFSRLRVRPPSLVKDSKSLQRSHRAWVVGEVPRFQTSVFGQENIQRERKGIACTFKRSAMRWDSPLPHSLQGHIFMVEKFSLKVSAAGGRGSERGQKGGELQTTCTTFFFSTSKKATC